MPKATENKRPRGDGSVYWNDRWGVYQGVIRINGKRRSVSDKNRDECAAKLQRLRQQLGMGGAAETDETLGEYLDSWLARQWAFVDTGEMEEKTIDDFNTSVTKAKEVLGDIPLKNLTALAIFMGLERLAKTGRKEKVYSGKRGNRQVKIVRKPLSRRTITKVKNLLVVVLDEATAYNLVPRNEARLVLKLPATVAPTEKRSLNERQVKIMLEAAEQDPIVLAFLLTGFVSGLRSGENMGARWDRLNWKYYEDEDGRVFGALDIEETLKVKGGYVRDGVNVPEYLEMGDVKGRTAASRRKMVLPPDVLQVLRRWQKKQKEERLLAGANWQGNKNNLIFTSRIGTPMTPRNMARRIARLLEGTELEGWAVGELTRHSFATLIEADLQPQILERAQGHAPGSNARKHYIHRDKPVITEHLASMERILGDDDAR